ncbi:single-stranded-DNA-specific exonuclease RecJ [Thermobrachium celere]|uniref:Single-stranded-DNA-specific exonuclease RecJ n=2 Tax=Thermobrachium TaxID=150333 RepID=R7RSU8_9CLOT|nr:single-stranded-DNA-specific exonuclease RecJ [Thermobrachium celere]CDF58330.1 Single-stranded-DNA-specific exonuclease RecJ [Thermobrachium celere DSM 8682]
MKKWVIRSLEQFNQNLHKNRIINALLNSRGIKAQKEAAQFLNPSVEHLFNPFLLKDMDRAVDRIDLAITRREKIVIYGDYDVDGITSTSILIRAFRKLGVDVSFYIPDRLNEGYGINKEAIDYIKQLATDLIITVDCGITAIEEVEYAKSIGMDIIITDHHECKEQIPNTIVINPKRYDCTYPNKNLAGCGVAFKLVQALWMKYNLSGFEDFLDLCAIGTVADIVELTGENRIIVSEGIKKIQKSEKSGIKALKNVAGISDVTSYSIAFQIAPRINAVGRLSDARIAVELFTTTDEDKAMQIAKYLDQENRMRQKIEEEILNESLIMIQNYYDLSNDRVIILSSPYWHVGVVGIVASRLVERFHRPVILLCEDKDGKCKGSGRSIEGFNLFENLLKCEDILVKFGGHELAAGLTIEKDKIDELRYRLNNLAKQVDVEIFLPKMYIDMEMTEEDITFETAEVIKKLEPYGFGNPSPLFYMENLKVLSKRVVGNNNKHLKLQLDKNNITYDGVYFNACDEFKDKDWENIDVVFNLDINEWNNTKNLQLMIKAVRPHTKWISDYFKNNYFRYLKFIDNNNNIEEINLDKIKFINKDENFLKEFVYFKKGYILVSSKKSLEELMYFTDFYKVTFSKNDGFDAQIIICPQVDEIDFMNSEVLIYDFLPGLYEYDKVINRAKCVYNFIDANILQNIDEFYGDVSIKKEIILNVYNDLSNNDITGTVDEMALKYNVNPYQMYKIIMTLKNNNFIRVFIKNDVLKLIKNQDTNDLNALILDDYTEKIKGLKNLLYNAVWEV